MADESDMGPAGRLKRVTTKAKLMIVFVVSETLLNSCLGTTEDK